jgi:uncharacterized protein involved in exopolysaccharide biosynthesis
VNDVSQRAPLNKEDEIDFIDLWWIVWDHRIQVAIVTALFTLLALFYALTATPLYRATVIVTEVHESGLDTGGGLAGEFGGLASLAGIDLEGSHPERQAVLRSRHLVEEFVKQPEVLPSLIAGEKPERTGLWATVERFRRNVLDIQEDKLKGITTITIDWKDPDVARRWGQEFVALANGLLRNKAIEDASRNVAYLKEEVEHTTSVEIQKVMYKLIEQETRSLMLAKGREEYAFMVVDPPVKAEMRISPRRTLLVLSGVAMGFFVGSFIAWLRVRFARRGGRARPRTDG